MLQSVLIDSDIAIDFLRGIPQAKELILPLWEKNLAFVSLLSVYELYAGMHPKEKEATESFIHACQIEILTHEICQLAAHTYQQFRKKGITLTTVDCLIWSTAKLQHHKIATRNLRHYPDKEIVLTL